MLYAINYVLGRDTRILIIDADQPNVVDALARAELYRRRLISASLQGTHRIAGPIDLEIATNATPEKLAKIWISAWCRDSERTPKNLKNPGMRVSHTGKCEVFNVLPSGDTPLVTDGPTWVEVRNKLIVKGYASLEASYAYNNQLNREAML